MFVLVRRCRGTATHASMSRYNFAPRRDYVSDHDIPHPRDQERPHGDDVRVRLGATYEVLPARSIGVRLGIPNRTAQGGAGRVGGSDVRYAGRFLSGSVTFV